MLHSVFSKFLTPEFAVQNKMVGGVFFPPLVSFGVIYHDLKVTALNHDLKNAQLELIN